MKLHDAEVSKVAFRHRVRMTWVLTLTLMAIGQQVNGATFKRPSAKLPCSTRSRIKGASGLEHDVDGPPSASPAKTAADALTMTTRDKERAGQHFTSDDEDKDEDDDYGIRPPPPLTPKLKRRAANETLDRRPRQPPRGVYFQTLGVPRSGRGLRPSGLRVSLPGADFRRDLFDVYARKRTMLLTHKDAGDLKAPHPAQDVVISSSNDNGRASTSISPAMHPAPKRLRRSAPSQASSKPATQHKRGNSSPSVRQAKPSRLEKKNAADYETVHDNEDEESNKDLEVISNEDIVDIAPRKKRSDSKGNTDDYDASFEGDEYEVPEDDGSDNKNVRVYKRLPRRVDDSDSKALDSSNAPKFTDPGNMKASDFDTSTGKEDDEGDEDAESVDEEDDKIRRQPRGDFMRRRQQQPSGGRFQRQRRKRHRYLTSKRSSTPSKAEGGGGGENVVVLDRDVKDKTLNDALANVLDDMVNNPDDLSYLNTLRRRRRSEAVEDPMYSESYRRKRGPETPRESSRLNPIPKKRHGGGADKTLTRPKRKFDLRDVIHEMDVEEDEDSDSNDDDIADLLDTRRKRQAPQKRGGDSDNNDDKVADFFRTDISKEAAQQMEGDKYNINLENSDLLRERTRRKAAEKNIDTGIPRSKRNAQDYVTITKDDQVKDEMTERELSNIALDYEEQTIPIVEDFDGDAIWDKRRRKRETYQVLPQVQDSSFGASSAHRPPNERSRKQISASWDLIDRVRDAMRRKAKRKVRAISSWSDDPLPPDSNETGGLNVRASHSVSKQTKSADDGEREDSASNEQLSDEDYPIIPLIAANQPQDNNGTTTDDVLGSAFADTDDAVEADRKVGKDDDLKDVPKISNLQNVTVRRRKRQATGDGASDISPHTPKPNFIDDSIHESIDFAHLPMAEDEKGDLGISHGRFDKHLGASPAAHQKIIRELKSSSISTEPSATVAVKINTVKAMETSTKENISLRNNQTDLRIKDTFSKRERGLLFLPADYSDENNVPLLHTRGKTFHDKDIVQGKTEKDRSNKMKRSATVETGDTMNFSPRRDVYDLTGRLKILPQDGNNFADKDFHTQSRVQGSLVANVDPQNSQWMSEQMNRSEHANQKPPSRRRYVLTSRQKNDAVGIAETPSQQKHSTGAGTTSDFANSSKVKAKVPDRYKDTDHSMDEVLSNMMKEVMGVDPLAQNYIDLTMIPESNSEGKEAVTAMSRSHRPPEKSSPVQNADNVAKSSDNTDLAPKSIAAPSRTMVQVTASALPAIPSRGSTLSPNDAVIKAEMADDTTGSEVKNAKGLADIRLANELAQAKVLLPSQAHIKKPIPVPRPVASSENRLTDADVANDLAENAVSNAEDLSDIRLTHKAGHAKTFTPRSILKQEQIPLPETIVSSEETTIKPKAEDDLVEKAIGNAEDLADISLTDELAEEMFPMSRPTASIETVLTEAKAANDTENEINNAEDMTYSHLAKELGLPPPNSIDLLKSDAETNMADDEISIAQNLEAIQTELSKLMGYNVTSRAEELADLGVDRPIDFSDLLDNPPARETSPTELEFVKDEKSPEAAAIKEEKEMLRELDEFESEAADVVGLERPTASQQLRRQRAWELVRDMLGRQASSRMLRRANHGEASRTSSDAEHQDITGTKPMPEDRRTQSVSNSEATPSQHNQQQRTLQQQQHLQEEEEQQQQAEGTTADKKNEDNPVRRLEKKLGTAGTAFQEAFLQKELAKIRKAQSFKDDRAAAETKTTGAGTPRTDSDDGKADKNASNASQTGRGRSSVYHNDHPDDGGHRVAGGGRQRRSTALDANSAVGSLGDEGEIDDDDGANEGADSNDLEARDGGDVDEQRLKNVLQGIHRLLGGAKHQRRFLRSVDTISESFEEAADENTFDEIGDDENVVESIVVSKLGSNGKMKTQGDVNKHLVLEENEEDDLNSGYSWWTDWSPCSVTCGIGRRQRSRICQVPGHCKGGNSQEDICTTTPCVE